MHHQADHHDEHEQLSHSLTLAGNKKSGSNVASNEEGSNMRHSGTNGYDDFWEVSGNIGFLW